MSAAVQLGDVVELEDKAHEGLGVTGQVWCEPADGVALVATGTKFVRVRETHLRIVERTLPEPKGPPDQTAKIVRARKSHQCGCDGDHHFGGHTCRPQISPGQQYVRSVLFPGDVNSSRQPWVMKLCLSCAAQFDNTKPDRLVVKS